METRILGDSYRVVITTSASDAPAEDWEMLHFGADALSPALYFAGDRERDLSAAIADELDGDELTDIKLFHVISMERPLPDFSERAEECLLDDVELFEYYERRSEIAIPDESKRRVMRHVAEMAC